MRSNNDVMIWPFFPLQPNCPIKVYCKACKVADMFKTKLRNLHSGRLQKNVACLIQPTNACHDYQQPYSSQEQEAWETQDFNRRAFSGESSTDSHCQQVFTEHLLCQEPALYTAKQKRKVKQDTYLHNEKPELIRIAMVCDYVIMWSKEERWGSRNMRNPDTPWV